MEIGKALRNNLPILNDKFPAPSINFLPRRSRSKRGMWDPACGAGISAWPSPGPGISRFGDPEPSLGLGHICLAISQPGHISVWGSWAQLGLEHMMAWEDPEPSFGCRHISLAICWRWGITVSVELYISLVAGWPWDLALLTWISIVCELYCSHGDIDCRLIVLAGKSIEAELYCHWYALRCWPNCTAVSGILMGG